MVRLQPRLPGRRKPKHEGKKESEGDKQKSRKNLLIFVVLSPVIILVAIVAIASLLTMQPAPVNALSDAQVMAELARVREMSMHPANMNLNPADYPKVFGTWNNFTLEERYFCSDVCPDYGRVDLVFKWVGAEQCESAGGRVLRDLAWGGYLGCQPKVG